eukprot:jgi/Bigna1/66959/fgenesh1_pg.2_\
MSWVWKKKLDLPDEDENAWEMYSKKDSKKIDQKKQCGVKVFELNPNYSIDLDQEIQFKTDDPYRQRPIKKTDRAPDEITAKQVDTMKLEELKSTLEAKNLPLTGTKQKLQERLKLFLSSRYTYLNAMSRRKVESKPRCRIYNSTGGKIVNSWDVVIGRDLQDRSTSYQFFMAEPGDFEEVDLQNSSDGGSSAAKIVRHFIQIGKQGLVVNVDDDNDNEDDDQGKAAEKSKTTTLRNGKTYHIALDLETPPLSEEDYKIATQLVRSMVEGYAPHPPPVSAVSSFGGGESKEEVDPAWRWIVSSLGRDGQNDDTVRKVKKMITDGSCTGTGRTPWYDAWRQHPQREKLVNILSGDQSQYCIEIYHRALDRFPGGNADMHVIKQILTVFPSTSSGEEEEEEEKRKKKRRKKNKKQQQQKDLLLQCVSYSNWDGESRKTMGGAFVLPQEKALEMKAKLLPAIAALLKSSSTSRGGGGKPMDFEITVDDDQFDSDEYDTQWSSIEILIYTYHNNDGHDSNGGISKEEGEKAATGAESNSVKQQRQLSARIHRRAYLTQNPGGTTRQPYEQR